MKGIKMYNETLLSYIVIIHYKKHCLSYQKIAPIKIQDELTK